METVLNKSQFVSVMCKGLGIKKTSKKENEADTYLKTRGADSNRRHAMHRKRNGY